LAALLACAVALSPNRADPDLWGHVQYGLDVFRDGLPATSTYSFTAVDYPWINHENLSELALAISAATVGPSGMLGLKCLLGLVLIGLIVSHADRQGVGLVGICVVALLVSVNLTYFWALRPQLASFICYGLLLKLLSWCFAGWEGRCWIPWFGRGKREEILCYSSARLRWLWLAPVLLLVWTNAHGGFVAGYCIFSAYLVLRGIEAVVVRRGEAWGLLTRFGMMIAAGGLATLINPYGPRLQLWLLGSLTLPRPEILEWHPPDLASTLMLPFWLIILTWLAALWRTTRPLDATHLIILALTLWQSLEHVRHIPFFAIAFGFWMAPHVDSLLARSRKAASDGAEAWTPGIRGALVAVLSLAFLLIGYQLVGRLSAVHVDRARYPVSAFQYIADLGLHGRMVVTFNWAQYAIAAFGGQTEDDGGVQVSFDGRYDTCYPYKVVDMNFDFVLGHLVPRFRGPGSLPFNDETVLEFGQPDLVLIDRHQPHGVNVMFRNRQQWVLLYQDKLAQLWGRQSLYGEPHSPDFIPVERRRITEDEQEGIVPWPALPRRHRDTQLVSTQFQSGQGHAHARRD
jgi:hypothetical protein